MQIQRNDAKQKRVHGLTIIKPIPKDTKGTVFKRIMMMMREA